MRKSLIILVIVFLSIMISISSVSAWTSYTHKWICDKINLTDSNCASADTPKVQSEHPDLNFKNHHCTLNMDDCSARNVAEKYLLYNSSDAKGFAAHMYSDSMVPVHWYSTDYDTCHKIFEDTVEEKLRNSQDLKYDLFKSSIDFSTWNVTMICPAKFGKEYQNVTLYADNIYMDITAKYVADQLHTNYTPTMVESYDLTPLIYVFFAFLIIVFTLFMYFGMKNSKKYNLSNEKDLKKKK